MEGSGSQAPGGGFAAGLWGVCFPCGNVHPRFPPLSLCQWFLVPLRVAMASVSPSLLCTCASALIDMQSFPSLLY